MLFITTVTINVVVSLFNCMLSIYFTRDRYSKYDNQLFYTACCVSAVAVIMDIVYLIIGD